MTASDGIGGFDLATGPLNVDLDPSNTIGTVTGTVGTITVNLSFLATEVSTSSAPYAAVEIVPTGQRAVVTTSFARNGRVNGTLSSPNVAGGFVTATNAWANASRYNVIEATA